MRDGGIFFLRLPCVVSHPFHDQTVEWMGRAGFWGLMSGLPARY
jgi:hypothetical protein